MLWQRLAARRNLRVTSFRALAGTWTVDHPEPMKTSSRLARLVISSKSLPNTTCPSEKMGRPSHPHRRPYPARRERAIPRLLGRLGLHATSRQSMYFRSSPVERHELNVQALLH